MNEFLKMENINIFEFNIVLINGIKRANSTSKIKKMMAIKKNWREKGSRAEVFGSNPHSKGDLFSRSI